MTIRSIDSSGLDEPKERQPNELNGYRMASLESLEAMSRHQFEECEAVLRMIVDNETRLTSLRLMLTAAREKVPHGKWTEWIEVTFEGKLHIRTVQRLLAEPKNDNLSYLPDEQKELPATESKASVEVVTPEEKPQKADSPVRRQPEREPAKPVSAELVTPFHEGEQLQHDKEAILEMSGLWAMNRKTERFVKLLREIATDLEI